MFVYTLAPCGDTLESLWDQTQQMLKSSQALKAYKYAGPVAYKAMEIDKLIVYVL